MVFKRSFTLLLALLASLQLLAQYDDPISRDVDSLLASQEPTFVHLEGFPVEFQVPPVIVNNRTFVELNGLFTALGIDLYWDNNEKKVTGITQDGTIIQLWIGRRTAYVNNSYISLDASPFIADGYGRTMIPLSFVATATGASVRWVNSPRTVDISNGANRYCSIHSLQLLADHVWRGYLPFGEAGPISITKATLIRSGEPNRTVYLVGLSGTDLAAVNQSGSATGILEDLIVGGWEGENDFLRAARTAIYQNVPANSSLIIAGHSLGGMVAQQLAADNGVKQYYNVLNTVTLGSPLIGALRREGEVQRLGDTSDIVPYLSITGTILQPWQVFGLNTESAGISNPIKAHNLSYRLRRVWGGYDALGKKYGTAVISFHAWDVQFFPAPRL